MAKQYNDILKIDLQETRAKRKLPEQSVHGGWGGGSTSGHQLAPNQSSSGALICFPRHSLGTGRVPEYKLYISFPKKPASYEQT